MFTLASVTATKPKAIAQQEVASPVASMAPTMITEEMRVGHRHQRRMQRRGHVPHHVVADEARHQEDGEQEHEGSTAGGGRASHAWPACGGSAQRAGREAGGLRRPDWIRFIVAFPPVIRRPARAGNPGARRRRRGSACTPLTMSSVSGSFGAFSVLVPERGQERQQVARIQAARRRPRCGRASCASPGCARRSAW